MLNSFLNEISQNNIQAEKVLQDKQDVSRFKRYISWVLYPRDKQEIIQIIILANKYLINVYPVSCGKNWGFGSLLPVENNSIIINMMYYNHIIEIDDENGYATITPGVTQEQLSNKLKSSPYFLDVTGASANSSIIGNALERGIAYNSLRVENISNLEILLPSGKIIHTGFDALKSSPKNKNNYKYGIGPSLDGLFFQSNLGIILQAKIKLLKRGFVNKSFFVRISSDSNLLGFTQSLKLLMEDNIINCIPHIFNKERFYPGIAPLIWNYFKDKKQAKSPTEINQFLENHLKGEWFAAGSLRGTKEQVDLACNHLKKMRKKGIAVQFIGKREKQILGLLMLLPFFSGLKALISATNALGDLTCGVPTNLTLASTQWPIPDNEKSYFDTDIDNNGLGGFIYFTPMCNYKQSDISKMISTTFTVAKKFHFKPAITLNAITPSIMEGVISVPFNKNIESEVNNAHAFVNELSSVSSDIGHFPYRTNIDMMHMIPYDDNYYQTLLSLKKLFDPNNILASGRYIGSIKSVEEMYRKVS